MCPSCDQTGGPAQESLTRMYADFIGNGLLLQLKSLSDKYAVWWTFKPNSNLQTYLNDHEVSLNDYFQPEELLNVVLNLLTNETHVSNSNVIELNEEQQKVFDAYFIFVPDIMKEHLLTQVNEAPKEISESYRNMKMLEDFYIDSPVDVIYKDPLSVFWINPEIDFALNGSTGNVYSWNRLLFIFTELCLNRHDLFTRHSDNILSINENTSLSALFQFKYFHLSQIETILKQATKFLGRKSGLIQSCPFLKHNSTLFRLKSSHKVNVFTFIDYIINHNNNLMPYFPFPLYL